MKFIVTFKRNDYGPDGSSLSGYFFVFNSPNYTAATKKIKSLRGDSFLAIQYLTNEERVGVEYAYNLFAKGQEITDESEIDIITEEYTVKLFELVDGKPCGFGKSATFLASPADKINKLKTELYKMGCRSDIQLGKMDGMEDAWQIVKISRKRGKPTYHPLAALAKESAYYLFDIDAQIPAQAEPAMLTE